MILRPFLAAALLLAGLVRAFQEPQAPVVEFYNVTSAITS